MIDRGIPSLVGFVSRRNHIAIPLARFAERPEPIDERGIEPDLHLSVRALGRRGLIDPGRVRFEGFVTLLGDRDADQAGQPIGGQASAPSLRLSPTAKLFLERP